MLSYAFTVLHSKEYKHLTTEEFENTADILAAILVTGVKWQLKHGLNKEYVSCFDELQTIKGKIDISSSLKNNTFNRHKAVCSYDEFSVDSYFNRIIKTTMLFLLRTDIPACRKNDIEKILLYFSHIHSLDYHSINWHHRFNKNNQSYCMLIGICRLAIKGLLHTEQSGKEKLMTYFDDQQMCRLYEKFILGYYQKEHPEIDARASQISWQVEDDNPVFLPKMQTDITLTTQKAGKTDVMIIDAKYYSEIFKMHYDKEIISPANWFELHAYVTNKDKELAEIPHSVSGLLLYAGTDELYQPKAFNTLKGGLKIGIRTLDLNQEFKVIKEQLDDIISSWLGV